MDGDEICGREVEAKDLAADLLKNREFFEMNGGGVTFTGGEPTMQAGFLCEVMDLLPGVHKAIETSGYCKPEVFKKILDRLDLVLFDIKHTDPEQHRRWTGVDNAPILANLQTLKRSGKPFVIRVPLIPGVNDSLENMEATRDLVKDAPGLQRLELLRYHKTAGAKYPKVDMEYSPAFDTDAEPAVHDIFGNIKLLIL